MKQANGGFTLIEFLAATLLACVVLASSLVVLRTVLQTTKSSLLLSSEASTPTEIADLLERDLAGALRVEGSLHRLIITMADVDGSNPPMLLRVQYVIEEIAGRSCLFRATSDNKSARSLIALDVEHLEIALADTDGWSQGLVVAASEKGIRNEKPLHRTLHEEPIRVRMRIAGVEGDFVIYPRGLP